MPDASDASDASDAELALRIIELLKDEHFAEGTQTVAIPTGDG